MPWNWRFVIPWWTTPEDVAAAAGTTTTQAVYRYVDTLHLNFDNAAIGRIESAVNLLAERINAMATDLTVLQSTLDALAAKAAETNATLADLAQAVIDLKNAQPSDVQPQIDALAVQAQTILDGLSAAEDAADDQVPPKP